MAPPKKEIEGLINKISSLETLALEHQKLNQESDLSIETRIKMISEEINPTFLPYVCSSLSGIVNKEALRIFLAKKSAKIMAKI